MGIEQTPLASQHWNYFLSLEDDLIALSRWIEFDASNFNCFSLELARLLLTASSEVDVVAKEICKGRENRDLSRANIETYRQVILRAHESIPHETVDIRIHGLTLQPWANWAPGDNATSPDWWKANNGIKHDRTENYHEASLKNVLNAVAGLFVLLTFHHEQNRIPILRPPKLFYTHHLLPTDTAEFHLRSHYYEFGNTG